MGSRRRKRRRAAHGGLREVAHIHVAGRVVTISQDGKAIDHVTEALISNRSEAGYWAVLWPSSSALAVMTSAADDLTGKRIIEVGCGVGAAGLVAAALGAEVILSDIEPRALDIVQANADANQLQVQTLAMDWNHPPEDLGTFDGILAADVMYDTGMMRGVLRFIRRHLRPGGIAAVTDPNRVMPGGVSGAARLHGLEVSSLPLVAGTSAAGGITLHYLMRKKR